MAQNLRDRGYGSSVENYLQQQKKKQTQKGPVSQKKEVYGPPAPNANQQKYHSRQTTAAPGTATVQKGNRVSGRSVGTIGAGKQSAPAPVSTQKISTVGYDRAAPASAGKLSEAEFSRSPAMQKSYGNYDNYTRGVRVTGGGFYHMDAPDFTGMQAAQSQYEQAYETIMGNLAKREKDLETAASMTGTLRPDQEVARGRAVEEYLKAKDAAERISRDYQTMRQENERVISKYMADIDDARSKVRNSNAIKAEYDDIERQISALNNERSGLQVSYQGGKLMEDVLAPFSPAASADALSSAMNASDRIKTIDRLIEELRARQTLLQEEMQLSRDNYWSAMASKLPDSVKRASDKSGAVYQHGVNIGDIITDKARYLTDEEKDTLARIVENYGTKKGREYYDYLSGEYLNTRRRRAEEDAMRKFVGSSDGVGEAAWWLDSVLLKPLSVLTYAGQMLDYLGDGRLQKDAGYNRFSYLNTAVRSQVQNDFNGAMEKIGPGWQKYGDFGYSVATSTLDFLYNWFLSAGIGAGAEAGLGAAGTSETLQSLQEAENLSLMLMGTEVAADTVIQAKDRGLSDGQAIVLGNAAGVIEIFSEKVSVEALLDGLGDRNAFAYLLKNFVSEGSEEGVSALMNKAVDVWVSKDQSEWRRAIRDYKNSNPGASDEEALKAVWSDAVKEIGTEMLAGGVSGLGMGFGFLAGNNYMQNRAAITSRENVSNVIRQAKGLDQNTNGYKAAQALQAKLDAGEKISVRDVQNTMREIDTDRRTSSDYVRARIADAERYSKSEAATKAATLQEKLDRGETASYRDVVALETAIDKARATSSEYLSPLVEIGKADGENTPAYKAAVKVEQKLQSGQDVTVREAAQLEKAANESLKKALDNGNAEVIGRRLVTEDGQAALAEAADTVAAYGSAEMQARAAEIREQMRTGEIDARTAGEVFLESERIWNRQQERAANTRALQPREVTEEMTELERTAAQIGVSEQETARVKAVADLLGADVRYFSEEAERFQRDGRNLIRTKNGYYDKTTGTIWLNAQSTNPVMTVLSHELTHSLETTESYGEFRKLVLSMAGQTRRSIEQTYESQNLAPEDIDHEVVARYVEEHLLTDEAAIRDAVQRNRSFGQWMRDQLDKVLAKLGNEDARERVTLQKARDLYAQALKEKAASRGETDGRLQLPRVEEQSSMTEEEAGPQGLELPKTEEADGEHIYPDAPEQYRYEVLKDKKLTARSYDKSKLQDVDLSQFETLNRTETEKLLRKIGEQFGVFKNYRNRDVAVEFQFSRNNLGESVHKQGGRYGDYAKMMTVFDDVIENAVGIETHSERYANKRSQLKQMYVLASAFKTEDGVVPVLMEVKEFTSGRQNTLYLTISLNAIAEADIVAYAGDQDIQATAYTPSASEYMIADIFRNVNVEDGKLLKYIPDGFLTDEQREAKQKALERTARYIAEKNSRKYQSSITEEPVGLELPRVEDTSGGRQVAAPTDTDGRLRLPTVDAETEDGRLPTLQTQEQQTEKAEKKMVKPVAESRPIEARRWLNRQTIDKFGIPEGKRKAAAETVQRYADKMIERGEVTEQDVAELFNALLYEGVVDVVPDDYSRTMREIVTGGKIHASASVKADFGDDWNAFRKRAFAAGLMLTNTSPSESGKVMGIDMIWHELSEMSPGLFPADEYDPRAQLEKIVQVAEQGMQQQMTLPEYLAYMNKTEGLDMYETADRMMAELAQDFKTFGEMAKLEVKLRDRTGVKIAQERERFGQIRDKEFRKAEKIRKEERARFRETQQRARERRQISELQQKTLKQLQWLSKNRLRAPEELRGTWDDLLGNLDIYAVHAADETHYSKKHEATYRDIISMYKEARANDPNFLPSKELERIMSRVDGEHLEDLDVDALRNLYQAITGLRTEFYNRNNAIMENETAALSDIFDETRTQMQAQRGYRDGFVSRILNEESLTPMNVLRRMVGWNRNSAWVQMARQLEQGEKIRRDYKVRAERLLEDFLNENKDWFTRADGIGKNAIWYEVQIPEFMEFGKGNKPIWGDTVTVWMTPLQKVHMYLESKSYDNLRHMLGGRTFADKALYEKGERARAFAAGTTVKLAPETVKHLVKDLSPEEMKLAKLLENYYNVWSKGRINEVSNKLYGYDKAMNANYAPILTNQNYVGKELGVGDATAAGVGNLKARIYSKNPSYNVSAIEAFERSVDQTGKFVGFAIAESNWQKLLNWQVRGDSMRDVITHTWDKQSLDYIENLIETLQGNRRRDGKLVLGESTNKLLSNYISAVFGANPGIVLKQAASFPQFAAVLGWTTAPNLKQLAKVDTELINTYTSELAYRQMGYATPETAQLKNNPGILQRNKALNFLFGGGAITAMDAATVKRGWAWAENYVRKNYPALEIGTKEQVETGESEFYKKVAEVFEDAVSTTQPMYDEMHRPYIMKEANGIARAFTMFKTVPLQQYNTLRRMWGEYDAARKAYSADQSAENREALRKTAWDAANSVTATIGSVLGLELVELLNALWKNRGKKYRDDDDELTAQSIGTQAAIQAAEDLMGMVPAGKELAQFLESLFMDKTWWGIEIPGGEQLNDFFDLIGSTYKQAKSFVIGLADVVQNGEDWKLYMRRHAGEYAAAVKTLIEKTGMYFGGLPLENLEKYIMGGVQFSPELSQAMENAFGYTDRSKLNGKTGAQLEKGVTDLFGLRGMQISGETAAAIGTLFENGNRDAVPQDTPDSLTIDGESVKLTESQKQRWERTWSQTGREVDALVESDAFKNADDETKTKMLNKLYELARIEANKTVPGWETDSKLPENVKTITDAGGSVADAAAWYGMTGRQGIKDAEKMQILADMDVSEQVKEAIFRAEKGDRTASDDGTLTAYGKLKAAQEAGLSVTQYAGFAAELGDSGVSNPDTYRVLAKQKLSDDQKAALFGTLGTPDEDGTQRQERMAFVRSAGMKVDDYLKWCETECAQSNKSDKLRALADADMSDRDRKIILSSLFSNRDTYQRDGQKTDYAKMQDLINAGMPVEDYCTVAAEDALTEYKNILASGIPKEYAVEAAKAGHDVKVKVNEQRYDQGLPTGDWVDYCVEAMKISDPQTSAMAAVALMPTADFEKVEACVDVIGLSLYIEAQSNWRDMQRGYQNETGEELSMKQDYVKIMLDNMDCTNQEKAWLFQMMNKSWTSAKNNPYSSAEGDQALRAMRIGKYKEKAEDEPKGLKLPYIEN